MCRRWDYLSGNLFSAPGRPTVDELAQERESGLRRGGSEVVSEALVTKRGRRLRESAGVPGPGGSRAARRGGRAPGRGWQPRASSGGPPGSTSAWVAPTKRWSGDTGGAGGLCREHSGFPRNPLVSVWPSPGPAPVLDSGPHLSVRTPPPKVSPTFSPLSLSLAGFPPPSPLAYYRAPWFPPP